ncbi:Druantia anti-phage system protein DruA [Desulfoscipio gibsoniae]|uniref:Druantia anti-phage system protein DruA n=1 Tax=Desulfoscipio gibsoniae TaxID=102134 RepID=UPI000232B439|nr:Druantia anti-phage system protein DruA [Desulfoscipio gibsoniae]
MIIQERKITTEDIKFIKELMDSNPTWLRTRLSRELCALWDWRNAKGQLKDMACLALLKKLEKHGFLTLPLSQQWGRKGNEKKVINYIPHLKSSITSALDNVLPLQIKPVEGKDELSLLKCFFDQYHYLGWSGTVGENMKYMVWDYKQNPLACLLFGAAAWACSNRDQFIGWDARTRKTNIHLITNNTRFLILPWVKVRYLASHILSQIIRRISKDWYDKYGHPVYLLETFVEARRFQGISYQASNWVYVGKTQGRGRNDRHHNSSRVPIKDIYLYPLAGNFREVLMKNE